MSATTSGLTLGATVACGLSAGVFFAFSSFVMPALERLDPGARVAAMQAINEKAVTPAFMLVLFGGALLCVVVLVNALRTWDAPSSPWATAGTLVFLVGVVGLTVARHVPLNDALATADPGAADAAARWSAYAGAWTPLNHVRAAAGTAATALLVVAMATG
ncbi:DUF1772 domain-containing protein [Patulibacter sp.]|uniref:anthrone oxygenase family protein n=1 Tax=Patulibacter sp. TaxID=1912859 RepID=UPI002723743C|nr:anthrone oxygenase family protein [Patulibacter sp.]MDO9409079.1 DUF1772 domain-containing protein [Patulibacter sp.]